MQRCLKSLYDLYTLPLPIQVEISGPRLFVEPTFPPGWQARPQERVAEPIPMTPGSWCVANTMGAGIGRWYVEPIAPGAYLRQVLSDAVGQAATGATPNGDRVPLVGIMQALKAGVADYASSAFPRFAPAGVSFSLARGIGAPVIIPVGQLAPYGCRHIKARAVVSPATGTATASLDYWYFGSSHRRELVTVGVQVPNNTTYAAAKAGMAVTLVGPFSPADFLYVCPNSIYSPSLVLELWPSEDMAEPWGFLQAAGVAAGSVAQRGLLSLADWNDQFLRGPKSAMFATENVAVGAGVLRADSETESGIAMASCQAADTGNIWRGALDPAGCCEFAINTVGLTAALGSAAIYVGW